MSYSIGTNLSLEEIVVNTHGDKIIISPDDSAMLDNFVKCFENVLNMANECAQKIEEIERRYVGKEGAENDIAMVSEISSVNVDFSNRGIKEIDNIFGDGTIRMYFRDHYEKAKGFVPGMGCLMEFLSQISPVMENVFGKTVANIEKYSKEKMAKYQPQDHKRKGTS